MEHSIPQSSCSNHSTNAITGLHHACHMSHLELLHDHQHDSALAPLPLAARMLYRCQERTR